MLNRILIIPFFIVLGCNSRSAETLPAGQASDAEKFELYPEEFRERLAAEVVILDVRTPEELSGGSISGATNVDCMNPDFKQNILALDKSKTYLVYCASGLRSGKAAEWMKQESFHQVYTLKGGIRAWEDSGFPVRKGSR